MAPSDIEKQLANLSPAKKALLERKRRASGAAPVLKRLDLRDGIPLSFAQQRFWLIHELDPTSYLYNVPRVVHLSGKLDRAALEASLNEVIRRHEALRTSFRIESGQPVQIIAPELRVELPISEVVSENGAPALDAALELALEEYRRPFDLATGPLLRARLWNLGANDHLLLIVMHHIISDGWSGGVLFDELGKLYTAFAQGQASPLAELSIQYPDFAVWQRGWMDRVLDKQIEYWKQRLAGAPPSLELPTDGERPLDAGFRGHLVSLNLSPDLAQRVSTFSRTQGTTLFPVILAALQVLMFRWTGQSDLVLGTVNANRNTAELEKLIGCFLNFLALREHIEGSEDALALLAKDKKTVLEAFANQDCPFEKVVEAVNPERAANVNPIYNVALLVQNYPAFAFRDNQLEARFMPLDTKVAFLDLRFVVTESAGAIVIECEANAELFERSTVDLLLAGFRDVLEQIVGEPTRKLEDFRVPDALIQQAQSRSNQTTQTIAVAASFTAEPVKPALRFWMKRLGVPAKIKFAPFNQIFQVLLDPASLLSGNTHGCNIILLRIEDLLPVEAVGGSDMEQRLVASAQEFVNSAQMAAQRSAVPFVICICPPSAAVQAQPLLAAACDRVQTSIVSSLAGRPNVAVVTPPELFAHYPVARYDDDYAWRVGKIPYTTIFFTALGTMLARRMSAVCSAPYQVIVVDCEPALWSRKDGQTNVGESQRILQNFLIAQQEAGRIICLVRKGSKDSAEVVFGSAVDTHFGWQHVTDTRFDERPSSGKLKELAEEFGLSLSSFIFVSASQHECAEVQANCEATVAHMPADAAQIQRYLSHFWAFDSRPAASDGKSAHKLRTRFSEIAAALSTVDSISSAIESEQVRRALGRSAYIAPRNAVEELLAGIWTRLLRIEQPGIHDNFFALGGHSLLAVQVIARVRETMNVEMPLRAMFDAPTIAEFAERVEDARRESDKLAIPPLRPAARDGQIPLSYSQQRLWFIDQLEPGNPFYNISAMYHLLGPLDIAALQKTINEIVRRHESLRTTFQSKDGEPVQVIVSELQLHLPISICTGLADDERQAEIQRFSRHQALQPFDLSVGPLLRFSLLKLAEEEHVLVVILHHIVGDGWSGSLLATEMAALYQAFSRNEPSPLPELTVQYADFAIWQRQWMRDEILDGQIAYWKKQLAGAPPVLELPTDRPRPAVQAHRGAIRTHVIAAELLDRLRALSQAEGATLFMTLLSAFQLLLSRYSGQDDIVVGSTVAGRNYSEIEPLIGFFVNTLAMRADLSGDPTFRDLLARVKQVALDGYAHQEIPFERLVEALQPERSLSYNPIFQVLFGLQNMPRALFEASGLKVHREPVHSSTSLFDMSWFAFEIPEGLLLRIEYDTDLFEVATIDRAVKHFEQLLDRIVEHPEKQISQFQLLTPEERHRVLVEFNDTTRDYPKVTCIHDFLAQQADKSPDATALICDDARISYCELNERANQLAHFLIQHGAGPDVPIGIYCRRTAAMVVGILGILKSGSAYVPLDPAYPKDRLANILEDSEAPIILTQRDLVSELPPVAAEVVCLDGNEADAIARQSRENPITAVRPENLAYVLFTSGSTGKPKGVALEHHSAVNFVRWVNELFTPEELSGVLFCTSICFDMSTFEMFVTLGAGGKMILAENPLYLPSLPARHEVTLINTVPSAITELVRIKGLPDSVKTVVLAGEALPRGLVDETYESTAVEKIYNMYGPTEVGYCTSTLVSRDGPITIGKPIGNAQAYILDRKLDLVPIGVVGEAYFSGEGVARGYYGRPDLTAERFLPNPFNPLSGSTMYKTGDLCRWQADGNIQYLGRIDHQVKVRGFRVELGEIEAVIGKHASVRQTIVMAREDEPGLKRLVAYVVPQDGSTLDPHGLRDHVKQTLPDFMVPAAVVVLQEFPLNPNGKIDRKALPRPDYSRDQQTVFIPPRTVTEERLAAIWAEVLHLPQIGAEDDFFSAGGHSLLATQVMSRVRQVFKVEIPLRAMFESPVLRGLAEQIDSALRVHSGVQLPPLRQAPRDQVLPLSAAQQSMWFLDQLDPDSAVYNIPSTHRLNPALNLAILQHSLDQLVDRHESLRTTFVAVQGQPQQVIAPALRIPIEYADFSDLPPAESERRAVERILAAARKPFHLATGPLLRVTVAQLAGGAQLLSIVIHHIISDRWSVGVFLRDLAELYAAGSLHRTAALPELPVQYADFAAWQREIAQGEGFQKQIAYWKEELRDVPPMLELPTDRPRPAMETFNGDTASIALSSGLTQKLHGLSRSHGATLFMTLLASFQALISRYSGQEDFAVGIPVASRRYAEIENLIGLFASTLPLRGRLQGDPTFANILQSAKDGLLNAYMNQDVPFEKLVEELQPERSLSHSPLVQVYFILQNAPVENVQFANVEMNHVRTSTGTSKGDLFFSLAEQNGKLTGLMEYKTDLFDRETIERMLGHFRVLLEAVAENPGLRLSQLPLLTSQERELMLHDWNATDAEYPRQRCVHELFEQQAERTPDAVACVFDGQRLTYRELNQRANQLARFLKKRGAEPGQRIGIFVERSLRMMVGLLGIQKTGAAYVPVDPAYPPARISTMLEDAAVRALLTEHDLLTSVPSLPAEIICMDSDWDAINRESPANFISGTTPEDLVYVIYTSGSTGKPKGVQVPHRAVVNLLTSMGEHLQMGPSDVFPALASFAFDMSIPELYLALVTGGCVAVGCRHLAGDGEELARFMKDNRATVVHATPTTWNLLLEAGFTGAGLKRVIGAEALPPELCVRLLKVEPSLFNFYGPTETTVWSTFHHFRDPSEPVVVGRPIANTQVYILDDNLQPAPIGSAREIYIAGDGVAHGYFNRAELTAEKFVPNPFGAPGTKMYRTGDLGRYLPDGRIECLGRADSQVKVRGYRIELGEIEAVLAKHPAVQECVVLAREDVAGDKKLVGYAVLNTAHDTTAQELRTWMKDRLPDYMVPIAMVEMEKFPLTPNGKVNRKALPAPDTRRTESDVAFVAPRTAAEEILASIWMEVLRLDKVSTHDNFFELGGHSLAGTQVISRAREAFSTAIPLRSLFEAPTIAALAERIEQLRGIGPSAGFVPLGPAQRIAQAPLSFAQQRLWFLDQLEPQNPLYNVPYIVRLQGPMKADLLEQSLNEILQRHESLRTRFEESNGEPVQIVERIERMPFSRADLSNIAPESRLIEARRLAKEEAKRPFDLRVAPLVRGLLVKLADDDHALVVNMHHIITDRWSFGVLSQELANLYEAYAQGKASPLEALPLQYADYAIWQRKHMTPSWMEQQVAYWKQQLEGAPAVLEIPTVQPRKPMENFWGGICNRPLPENVADDLRVLSRRNGATLFMTLLAAFQLLLGKLSEQEDIVVGTDLANRTQTATEKLIGFFVNLLPIRTQVASDLTFTQLLRRVREVSLGAFAHQDVPFEKLVEELRPERSLTHHPIVQVLFVMQNTPRGPKEFGGLKPGPLGVSSTSRFDLVLFINNPDDAPITTWMYNPNLFDEPMIRRFADLYEVVLRTVAADSGLQVQQIHMVLQEADLRSRETEQKSFHETSLRKLKGARRKVATAPANSNRQAE